MTARPIAANEELARARTALAAAGCDAALLSSPASVTYAGGWEVPVPLGALAELAWGQPLLLLTTRDAGAWLVVPNAQAGAAAGAGVDEVLPFDTFDSFRPTDTRASFLATIREALGRAGLPGASGTLAVEGRTLPHAVSALLAEALPGWRLAEAEGPLAAARLVKTEREIGLLRRAAALADIAQVALAEGCREAGRTEYALWAEVAARVFAAAGRDVPLTGELVTGPRTTTVAYPNGPRGRTMALGDPALMDLSGRLDGYWFDATNTLLVGGATPSSEQLRLARAAQAACEAAMAALRPGAVAADAARAAEAAFAGFGLPMAHYAGHQIGVGVNELPRLVPYDRTPIVAGMVFSVEPGAYAGPGGDFGARFEKMVLVTPSGPEILSTFAWEI